jgi:hypothetical protein
VRLVVVEPPPAVVAVAETVTETGWRLAKAARIRRATLPSMTRSTVDRVRDRSRLEARAGAFSDSCREPTPSRPWIATRHGASQLVTTVRRLSRRSERRLSSRRLTLGASWPPPLEGARGFGWPGAAGAAGAVGI